MQIHQLLQLQDREVEVKYSFRRRLASLAHKDSHRDKGLQGQSRVQVTEFTKTRGHRVWLVLSMSLSICIFLRKRQNVYYVKLQEDISTLSGDEDYVLSITSIYGPEKVSEKHSSFSMTTTKVWF